MHKKLKMVVVASLMMASALAAQAKMNPEQIVSSYLQAWGEKDTAKREQILRAAVIDKVRHNDSYSLAETRPELDGQIVQMLSRYPGMQSKMVGNVRTTGSSALFEWSIVDAAGAELFHGVDAVIFADDGRLQRIDGHIGLRLQ
ncbi:hypothetical protein HQ393_11590 [Chitinibacter bivalviorum]|uniref:Nuclear transport factor 2 family protein n=1 Tax=Chitinibacter bivalviorum TaxID=2739434 RepID=A0A7H9BJR8_9NEIS|nr:hypothetical protein [Chitinibacter bivalviorum]QLG88823.1 hypothetical protein HQ393_11590 [Chitinibacter bivalviorum]